MSSHMGTNFLNSCIKVPIDPCNNCPAPVYNRQKIILSRSTTSASKVIPSANKTPDFDLELDTIYASNGMRSLAKFYDSIPDYCEVNHLSENDFYSTLETLKITYRNLKSKPSSVPNYSYSRNESSNSSIYEIPRPCKAKTASSKRSKKKTASRKSSTKKDYRNSGISQCCKPPSYKNFCDRMKVFDYKMPSLDVESLFKQPLTISPVRREPLYKSLSMHHLFKEEEHLFKEDEQPAMLSSAKPKQTTEDNSVRPGRSPTTRMREYLWKSFSFNDLNSTYWQEIKEEHKKAEEAGGDVSRSPETHRDDVPNITVQPPSPLNLSDSKMESAKGSNYGSAASTSKKKLKKSKPDSTKVPFSFLGINDCKISEKTPSVSPVHPVARPNLAATLRLEVSKKKVRELQNNCTFQDTTPQIDWEVRKTPAWKSLSHNESHKEILAMRLATRKAEQDLQKRAYEMHMEIMRQRVKSAPLLLEGSTFWGPHVGKLSHSCHKDNLKHNKCQQHGSNTHKMKKANKPLPRKCLSNVSYSRNSNHSSNLQESDELSSLDRAYL